MAFRDQAMKCPRCGVDLVRYDDRDKWRCKTCNGALVGGEQLEVELGELAKAVLHDEADPARPAIHPCPVCAFPMTPYTVDTIEIDRCVGDSIVWFDGGEIGKVRAAIAPAAEPLEAGLYRYVLALAVPPPAEAVVEIPPEVPPVIGPGEWQQRTLCTDGTCNGVIGSEGTCHVCGRAATA